MPKINLRKGLLVLANLAGFGAATSLFPWEFSTGLCHCMSLLKGGGNRADVAGGKRTPGVAVLALQAGTSNWGKSFPLSPRRGNKVTAMGPIRRYRAGREILREDIKKRQSRHFDSSNSPPAQSRRENIHTGEELPH